MKAELGQADGQDLDGTILICPKPLSSGNAVAKQAPTRLPELQG